MVRKGPSEAAREARYELLGNLEDGSRSSAGAPMSEYTNVENELLKKVRSEKLLALAEEMSAASQDGSVTLDEITDEAIRRGYFDECVDEMVAKGKAAEGEPESPEEVEEELFRMIEIHIQKFGRDELNDTKFLDDETRKEVLRRERKNPFPTAS